MTFEISYNANISQNANKVYIGVNNPSNVQICFEHNEHLHLYLFDHQYKDGDDDGGDD